MSGGMEINCYGSGAATLPPLEQLLLGVLRNARGFAKGGMTLEAAWQQMYRDAGQKARLTTQRRERLRLAAERLQDAGMAKFDGAQVRVAR